jgi:predicted ATPase
MRTLDLAPGNLRPQPTSFIGRERELAGLREALKVHRLVTLTGVGGVGKTRLALQAAAQITDEFPEGVFLIELASVGDPGALPDAVANVLGITQQAGMTVAESVTQALEGRQRLLLLDNCEHVLDAAAEMIESILTASSTVTILATSREALGVAGEHRWLTPSMSVESTTDSEGVSLFIDRARSGVPGFSIATSRDREAVTEICRRLDGIPLAIELAASRMVSMSPVEVRDRLDDRFRLLTGSRRGLERHQTLHHAVQWSYDLLAQDERKLLIRCSVFAGGFDLAQAVVVGGGGDLDEYTVVDLLDSLVRKSLLNTDHSSGRTRYSMLETIRQFAESRLAESGDGDAVRDAHAGYFAAQEQTVIALWNDPRQREAYAWFEAELANLRVAFRWASDRGDLDTAATVALLSTFFGTLTQNGEPVTWAEELIEWAKAVDHPILVRLYQAASTCAYTGRPEQCIRYCDAARSLWDDPRYEVGFYGFGLAFTAQGYVLLGQPERSIELCQFDLERREDPLTVTRSLLVMALTLSGRADDAAALANDAVIAAEASDNPLSLCLALGAFGLTFVNIDPPAALAAFRRGLVIARESGNRQHETFNLSHLARLEVHEGDLGSALEHLASAISAYLNAGNLASMHNPLALLAALLSQIGLYEVAAIIAGFARTGPMTLTFAEFAQALVRLQTLHGRNRFESLAKRGELMDAPTMVRYALEKIEQARPLVGIR